MLAGLLFGAGAATAAEPLKVCVDEDNPPFSLKRKAGASGFDLALARVIAERLGRPLQLQWFEGEYEKERSAVADSAALLSAGLCDLLASYPLYEGALGAPAVPSARLPDYDGAPRSQRGRRVPVGALAATAPYYFTAFAVVLPGDAASAQVRSLSDLKGMKIGAASGTLADGILRGWQGGVLAPDVVSLRPRENPLKELAAGRYAATLIELPRLDAWRARSGNAPLADSGYRHPLGFNLGYAALAEHADLIAAVDRAIEALRREGKLEQLAAEAGLTWMPPREPKITPRITRRDLVGG